METATARRFTENVSVKRTYHKIQVGETFLMCRTGQTTLNEKLR